MSIRLRDWLYYLAVLAIYALLAILIGITIAYSCERPDPAAKPVVPLSRGELSMLARLAWAEARGEPNPYCSMLGVAAVVINRMRTNPQYFGATITQVIHRPNQFSVFGKNDPNRRKMDKVDESNPVFTTALLAALSAASGIDPVHGSTYFYSGRTPRWSHGMAVKAKIAGHTFLAER